MIPSVGRVVHLNGPNPDSAPSSATIVKVVPKGQNPGSFEENDYDVWLMVCYAPEASRKGLVHFPPNPIPFGVAPHEWCWPPRVG